MASFYHHVCTCVNMVSWSVCPIHGTGSASYDQQFSYEYGIGECAGTIQSTNAFCEWSGLGVMSEADHRTTKTPESRKSLKNKCLNERRRRDQENLYFEELAELISASITDMNSFSVKPEKCAILQESLNQIKQIKQEAGSEAVQQSQVSSSKPSVLANNILGPLLLEALDGFLFVVNSQGKVEFVSENVTAYLKYVEDDLVGKSIYNIIHVGDHAQFSNSLLPMSLGSVVLLPSDAAAKGRTFNCRMLVKPPCEENDDVEIKQTYVSQYENMQISAILQSGEKIAETSDNTSSDGQSCLVCIARRISLSENTNTMLGIEQFTTKQDLNGKIIAHDTSGIAHGHYNCPNFIGQNLQDFCHTNDVQTLSKHIQEVLKSGNNTSSVYRFKLQDNRYVFVQTKSQLFPNRNNGEAEYVLSTHSIIRECDSDIELKGSASTSLMKSIIGQSPLSNTTQRSNPQIGGIPNSISMMLGTINNFMNSNNSGILAPPEENLENITDPFNSTSWDNAFASSDINTMGSNGNFPMSIVSSTTSNVNSWNNMGQIKPPPPQMPPASQQRPMMSLQQQQQMSTLLEKQRQQPSTMNFQRSNSFESGGQKSPRFSPSPNTKGPFQMPNQRMAAMMGYPSQRSPGSSNNNIGQNRMSPAGVAYPVQRTPPMSSSHQSGNLTQSQQVYLRLHQQHAAAGLQRAQEFSSGATTMPSQLPNPLQALQSMDNRQSSSMISASSHLSQSPRLSGEFTFPLSSDTQMTIDKRTNHRAGKLCQLLTRPSSSPDFDIYSRSSSVDSNASVTKAGGDNFVLKSPADSGNQSPTPGPGQSPQDKPQSTTHNDEGDHSSSKPLKEPKTNNVILKQLLSQEEEVEEQGASSADVKEEGATEMDKNEAEAKKSSNVLLKQLLSEDNEHEDRDGEKGKGKQRKLSGELLQILLNEQEENCTSAPAESTSQDADSSSRQRHQSGPQEPQSTTMTPMTPVTPLTPLTPLTPQSLPLPPSTPTGSSQAGQPLRSQTPQQGISFSQAQTASSTSSLSKGTHSGPDQNAKKLPTDTSALIKDKNLDNLLNYIWEKGNEDNTSSKTLKRKLPPSDVDSASDAESDMTSANSMHSLTQPQHLLQTISQQDQQPQQTQQPQGHSSLIQKNALLAKLLSKKNAKETKIFTQLTVPGSHSNPSENPQQRFPKNLSDHLLVLKPNSKKDKDSSQERKDSKMETSLSSGKLESMKSKSLGSLAPMQGLNGGLVTTNSVQGGGMANLGSQGLATNQQQFQEQYEQLQQLLSGTVTATSQQQVMNMEVDQVTGDSSDSLLDQILQQAADLQQDINKGNIQQIGSGTTTSNNNLSDEMIISQLEQVLGASDQFPELDSGMSDMMAIEAIQKQLMSEEPVQSGVVNGSTAQPNSALSQAFPAQQTAGALLQSQGFNQNLMAQQQNQQMTKMSTSMDLNFQLRQMGPPGQPQTPTLSPQQPFSQAAAANFGPQGPRLPGPQGPHASALSGGQQRQMFSNPSSTAIQVRQSLLQQQKLKQMREVEKQRQERQRLLVQRQLNQQFNQRFPQNIDNQVQAFPENLGDLMNSGSAPNVTIQRNQIPGPMSPRFAQGGLQQLLGSNNTQLSQQNNLNQLLGPSTPNPGQMSPHFNQPQTPTQWARQQGSMGMPQNAGGQFNMNRHRSLSGGSIPSPGQQSRFQFPDSQFNGNQSSGSAMQGMYNQSQSQQMFNQNRMMQRQMSMPQGRGSPRTPHSPYGNSPDPLLMSPHSMSPNNTLRQQQQTSQVSPPFNQSSMSSATGNFTQSIASMPGMNSQTQSIGSQGFQGFDLQQQLSELESKKIESLGLGMAPSSTSQYVKQELRNICSARSEKQLQQHQQQHQAMQQVSQNASGLAPQPQQQQKETYESEIPLDIFEQINEMAKEHGVNPGHPGTSLDLEDFKEEDVLKQKRQEAKHIYEQFQALAKVEKPEPAEENPEVKATKLFRTQLLTPQQQQQQQQQQQIMARAGKPEAMQIQVVQKEPRSSVEDMKPADHKNSLLQQLLSE